MSPIVVFLSLFLNSPQRHIALDAPVWDETQGYQVEVKVYTTTPPAGEPIVAISLLNRHMQNCVCGLFGKWMLLKWPLLLKRFPTPGGKRLPTF